MDELEPKWLDAEGLATFYNPKTTKNLIERYKLHSEAQKSKALQKAIIEKCAGDPIVWVDFFMWSADPRNLDLGKPVTVPFICFKRQQQYINWRRQCRHNRTWGLAIKSRDSGFSWLNVGDHVHSLLFEKGYKGGLSSRKAMFVDQLGNLDTLFEKARFILKHLPVWMIPGGKDGIIDNYCRIINQQNESSLIGEAGDNIGRGGRMTVQDIDEAAYVPQAERIARSLSQTTNVVFWTSTPDGLGNYFARAKESAKFPLFWFLWQHDPRKDEHWYKKQEETFDKVTLASEVNADFYQSMEGAVFENVMIEAALGLYPIEQLLSNRFSRITAGLDTATSGKNKSVYTVVLNDCYIIKQSTIDLTDTTEIALEAHRRATVDKVQILACDLIGVGEGVVSTLQRIPNRRYEVLPVRGNQKATDFYWVTHDAKSSERFINVRAELPHYVALKMRNSVSWRGGNKNLEQHELLCIDPKAYSTDLKEQLLQIQAIKKPDGKVKIKSKEEMRDDGISSPDHADSLLLAFAPGLLLPYQ